MNPFILQQPGTSQSLFQQEPNGLQPTSRFSPGTSIPKASATPPSYHGLPIPDLSSGIAYAQARTLESPIVDTGQNPSPQLPCDSPSNLGSQDAQIEHGDVFRIEVRDVNKNTLHLTAMFDANQLEAQLNKAWIAPIRKRLKINPLAAADKEAYFEFLVVGGELIHLDPKKAKKPIQIPLSCEKEMEGCDAHLRMGRKMAGKFKRLPKDPRTARGAPGATPGQSCNSSIVGCLLTTGNIRHLHVFSGTCS